MSTRRSVTCGNEVFYSPHVPAAGHGTGTGPHTRRRCSAGGHAVFGEVCLDVGAADEVAAVRTLGG